MRVPFDEELRFKDGTVAANVPFRVTLRDSSTDVDVYVDALDRPSYLLATEADRKNFHLDPPSPEREQPLLTDSQGRARGFVDDGQALDIYLYTENFRMPFEAVGSGFGDWGLLDPFFESNNGGKRYQAYGSTFGAPRFCKYRGRFVLLTGQIKRRGGGPIPTTDSWYRIATMPVGYRPLTSQRFRVQCSDNSGTQQNQSVRIDANGVLASRLEVDTTGTGWHMSLNGVMYDLTV
jgi:hypothetical protein